MTDTTMHDGALRERAIGRLRKRHEFYGHLLVYALVNGFLVLIWAMTNPDGFFWPVFPMVGWGIGLVMHAWDTFCHDTFDEAAIGREVRRLERHG